MGVLGCTELISPNFFNNQLTSSYFDVCSNSLYHGIDWIYSSAQTVFSYDFRVWYIWSNDFIFDDSFSFFFNIIWYYSLQINTFQLFWSSILDLYTNSTLFQLPYTDSWYKNFLTSKESSLILFFHPELIYIINNINIEYFSFMSSLYFSIFNQVNIEGFYSPIILVPQLIFLIFFATLFIIFYFSYFNNANKEEVTIDADYLVSAGSVESEKEITSYDDIVLALIVIIYIFGWYFYVNCWSIMSVMPELVLVFYLFPGLYFVIIGIPTFLMWDFGIFFLAYLRGIGPSPVLVFELVYDYIAVIIFYTRILVQGVRLVLMLFTYISMHDLIVFFSFSQKIFFGSEMFMEELSSLNITLDTLSYFILFSLPGKFIYWIYEILHTFFVVTVQFIAFFAIVFWLFLFLYTFFVIEKQENYFYEKRLKRKAYYSDLKN